MKIFLTVLCILLILILAVICLVGLILLIPVTLRIYYNGEKPQYFLKILGIPVKLGGKKKKAGSQKTSEKKQSEQDKLLSQLGEVKRILPPLLKRMTTVIGVKKLDLTVTVATGDPCNTALTYGAVNAAVAAVLALLESRIKIKDKNISILADYSEEKTSVQLDLILNTVLFKIVYALILLSSDGIIDISQPDNNKKRRIKNGRTC